MQSPCDPFFGFPPGQDPEVMPGFLAPDPTSSLTVTLPLPGDPSSQASPWPPLSREQVVKLHEALTEFLSMMDHGYGGPNDEQMDAATAARRLEPKLLALGLGMLPIQTPRGRTISEIEPALSRWLRDIQSADNATDWASHVWSANDALRTSLLEMGIQPAEEPTFQTKWAMLEAVLAEREATAALASSPLGVVRHNCPGGEPKP